MVGSDYKKHYKKIIKECLKNRSKEEKDIVEELWDLKFKLITAKGWDKRKIKKRIKKLEPIAIEIGVLAGYEDLINKSNKK